MYAYLSIRANKSYIAKEIKSTKTAWNAKGSREEKEESETMRQKYASSEMCGNCVCGFIQIENSC